MCMTFRCMKKTVIPWKCLLFISANVELNTHKADRYTKIDPVDCMPWMVYSGFSEKMHISLATKSDTLMSWLYLSTWYIRLQLKLNNAKMKNTLFNLDVNHGVYRLTFISTKIHKVLCVKPPSRWIKYASRIGNRTHVMIAQGIQYDGFWYDEHKLGYSTSNFIH